MPLVQPMVALVSETPIKFVEGLGQGGGANSKAPGSGVIVRAESKKSVGTMLKRF